MKTRVAFVLSVGIVAFASHASAYELSRYREFQIGMSLPAVALQAEISAEPRVVQQRPALIQELIWQPRRLLRLSPDGDSVRTVLFSFYNGQLFRMAVTYDRDRTEGLTAADLIDAISTTYGPPAVGPLSTVPPLTSPTSIPDRSASSVRLHESAAGNLGYEDTILARWDDSEYSVHLFESVYASGFGLVVLSKPIAALAEASIAEAARLDVEEAPQREIERQQRQTEAKRLKNEVARRANKAGFRP